MPPPELKPQLTKEEQQTLEKMKQICAGHGKKSPQIKQTCATLKLQQIRDYEQKQLELKNAALQKLNTNRMKAFGYISAKMNKVQNEGTLLSNALQKASSEYDMILGARAAQPIMGEIIVTLAFTVIPELKIVGRAAKNFAPRITNLSKVKLTGSVDDGWGQLFLALENKTKTAGVIVRFSEYLDNQSKDIIEAIKNPLTANAGIDEETQKRLSAFNAKNQILTYLIKSIERKLVLMNLVEPIFYKFIFWYEGEDLQSFVEFLFKFIGFESDIAYDGRAFDLFSDLILYDMLREYTRNYFFVFSHNPELGLDFMSDDLPESYIDGLDLAQRKLIYNRFGKVPWSDPSRPPVNSYKDLIRHWKNGEISPAVSPY